MLPAFGRTPWPRGPRDPGTPVGSKLPSPLICWISTSETFGLGTPSGNSHRKRTYDYLVAAGLAPTFKGNISNGDAPSNNSRAVIGSTVPSHSLGGSTDSVQFFGVGNLLHPCDVFVFELGMNDGTLGPADPNAVNFDTNLPTLWSQLVAREPGSRYVDVYTPDGGDATRISGVQFINANKRGPAWASIRGSGGLLVTGDARVIIPEAHCLLTESPSWLHQNDAGCLDFLAADVYFPLILNACGYPAVWPGERVV